MNSSADVFDAVRRGYDSLCTATNDEIRDYFSTVDPDSMGGHVSNVKGILFEYEYVNKLTDSGISAEVFELTNHPLTDVTVFDDGGIGTELQLKATDSVAYVNSTLAENPDIPIVATSEVASKIDSEMVIDSGIEEALLEEIVADTLFQEALNPMSPLSIVSWLFGLPF